MKILIRELIQAKPSLIKVLSADLPVKVSYRLSKGIKALNRELEDYEEKRVAILKKYSTEKEGQWEVDKDKLPDFTKEMTELMNIEIDINAEPVNLSLIQEIKVSALDLENLAKFINDDLKDEII